MNITEIIQGRARAGDNLRGEGNHIEIISFVLRAPTGPSDNLSIISQWFPPLILSETFKAVHVQANLTNYPMKYSKIERCIQVSSCILITALICDISSKPICRL